MFSQILLLGVLALLAFAKAQEDLPQLKLSWGTWQATIHPEDSEIYIFRNVRFGAEPERFGAPAYPQWRNDSIQEDSRNICCKQVHTGSLSHPPGGRNRPGDPRDEDIFEDEDCLFLDIYAPVSAFQPGVEPLPVVVWIYGGAYAFGSKNPVGPLNTGRSMLRASEYGVIFVAGNYRLGAFGWLSGSYMQEHGQPNAGLYDQALLLQWVQDNIGTIGGDKNQVSAWGESAGAGSILHHLVREDGERDPLFNTFVAQSPAFEWAWDNKPDGQLDAVYKNFSELAGCGCAYDIDCLRATSVEKLTEANQNLFKTIAQTGLFPIGPAVDGKWIRTIPTVAFSEGKFWNRTNSAIISHCANETGPLAPPNVDDPDTFNAFLKRLLPDLQVDEVNQQYDCAESFEGDYRTCIQTVIRDVAFTCNTRDLFEAYSNKSYMMKYAYPWDEFAFHSTDLYPLFMNNVTEIKDILVKGGMPEGNATIYAEGLKLLVKSTYQKYFASFALSGDPNTLDPLHKWETAVGNNDKLSNVMQVEVKLPIFNNNATDDQNGRDACSFWTKIAKELTSPEKGHTGVKGTFQSQLLGGPNEL
ncbi:carboxylesterase family protein [Whalleya microplaca]|nr:carboxylesterase family protein [Whalleya microplaca]